MFKKGRQILYVGKATSLKDRVKSYFGDDLIATRGPMLVDMVTKAKKVDFIETDSVLEALILEANLIKKYQPIYNTKEKSDKSFNYVGITSEPYPKVIIVRGKDFKGHSNILKNVRMFKTYGPYTSGSALKEALKIIRRIFPFLDEKSKVKGSYEFYRQIGLAPEITPPSPSPVRGVRSEYLELRKAGARRREAGPKDFSSLKNTFGLGRGLYLRNIKNIKLFFEGKKARILKNLEREMKEFAKHHEFEKANEIKKQLFALKHINDIALIKNESELAASSQALGASFRIEAYDIAHTSGKDMVGAMTVVEDGEAAKSQYRKFRIRGYEKSNDTGALREVLERRFSHPEWKFPNLIVVDGGKAQINVAKRVLDQSGLGEIIEVVSVVKDERHRPKNILGNRNTIQKHEKEILLANHEAHRFAIKYHRSIWNTIYQRRSLGRLRQRARQTVSK